MENVKRRRNRKVKRKILPGKQRTTIESLLSNDIAEPGSDSDFGDENPLTEEQAAQKAQKRKSLRFYSSQIAQKATKRGAASRQAGGDDDLPHKERTRDRQERLLQQAEKRGQETPTDLEQLGDDDDDDNDSAGAGASGDEYYQELLKAKKKHKAEPMTRIFGQHEEAQEVIIDGKRGITYAIAKNKGLMPKRSKDVRNPRVKKRKKYDEKKKKLGSMRQLYKGGEGRGGYGGEMTGIKMNLVKSVKL